MSMLRVHSSIAALATILLLVMPTRSVAGVISPANSTSPPALSPCPMGDYPLTFVTRDLANNTVPGVTVVIDFSQCPGASVCPVGPPDAYVWNPTTRLLSQITDGTGTARFLLRVGGTGPAGSVTVFGNGILFASYALASPDQDGNGAVVSVIGNDDPLFAGKLGTSDPTADFDGDGDVDETDEQFFFTHHSHSCFGYVDPTARRTWSHVKQIYR